MWGTGGVGGDGARRGAGRRTGGAPPSLKLLEFRIIRSAGGQADWWWLKELDAVVRERKVALHAAAVAADARSKAAGDGDGQAGDVLKALAATPLSARCVCVERRCLVLLFDCLSCVVGGVATGQARTGVPAGGRLRVDVGPAAARGG